MKKYIEKLKQMKKDLKFEYSVNREFAILQTKLEDLEIYFKAYENKLVKRGDESK